MDVSVFSGGNLLIALAVFVGVCVLIATVGKANDTIQGWKKPRVDQTAQITAMLSNDKHRLDAHEQELSSQRECQKVMMKGIRALMEHEIHNGNEDELKKASSAIDAWLLGR